MRRLVSLGIIPLIFLALVAVRAAPAQTAQIAFERTDAVFANPERGFYTHQSTSAEGSALSYDDLVSLRTDAKVSLVLRLYYLRPFRNEPLSEEQLDLIRQDFETMRAAGVKAVLRFAYSQSPDEPDAPLETIEMHLDQLEPLLRSNKDVIAAVEAGFIGAWGEWYYSTNELNNTVDRRAVLLKWLEVLPTDRMVQVRTPNYKKAIFDRTEPLSLEEAFGGTDYARTGHHNDCFLASSTDYGTYQNIEADKAYLEADTRFTTMGGETCNPNPPRSECETALEELERFHWSYLNKDYHTGVLGSWLAAGCLDEVKRRLGYRFALVDAELTSAVRPGGTISISLRIANEGFAAPYNPRRAELVLRSWEDGSRYVALLPTSPRLWEPGDTSAVTASFGVPSDLPEGTYDFLLFLPAPEDRIRERPEYAIRLANEGVWEPQSGYNDLLVDLEVSENAGGQAYSGATWLRPYESYVGISEPPTEPGIFDRIDVFPNPFIDSASIQLTVGRPQRVRISVYDVLGRLVRTVFEGALPADDLRTFALPGDGLPSGLYILRVVGEQFEATRQVTHLQ